jgi:hypothetical protein
MNSEPGNDLTLALSGVHGFSVLLNDAEPAGAD